MLNSLVYSIKSTLYSLYKKHKLRRHVNSIETTRAENYGELINSTDLTPDEILAINAKWGFLVGNDKIPYGDWKIYKAIKGFNPDYLSLSLYDAYILPLLNPVDYVVPLANKSMLRYTFEGFAQPETVIRCVNGIYFDGNNHIVSRSEAITKLATVSEPCFLKPGTETNSSDGIVYIQPDKDNRADIELFLAQNNSFIAQKKLIQSDFLTQLNPTSLNTMRLTTLLLPDGVKIISAQLKIGKNGAIFDNSKHGSIFVGINENGILNESGARRDLKLYREQNGVKFANLSIPNYDTVKNFVMRGHLHVAPCHIIGWDIALDKNNQPVLIEANTFCPSITYEQIASGPIFGKYTDAAIDYIKYLKSNK